MSYWDFIRLRGTVVAISTFFTIVSLYVIIDQPPANPVSSSAGDPTTRPPAAVTTIPTDNRLCGLAQRLRNSLPDDEPTITQAMQGSTPKPQPSPKATYTAISPRPVASTTS